MKLEKTSTVEVNLMPQQALCSNRVLMPLLNEGTVYAVMEGVATAEAVDEVFRSWGWPILWVR